jgi:hypothetical protein
MQNEEPKTLANLIVKVKEVRRLAAASIKKLKVYPIAAKRLERLEVCYLLEHIDIALQVKGRRKY